MHIYNTTINIDSSVKNDWLTWMQEIQIPAILATEKFVTIRICEVLIEEEMGGTTYAIQHTAKTKEDLDSFLKGHATKFDNALTKLFQGKYGVFSTELKVISEH